MGWLFGKETQAVTHDTALKGGRHPVLAHPRPHAVLGTPITGPWEEHQRCLIVAMGCYWGAEKLFWTTPGVVSTSVGFAGGYTPNPTYRESCTGRTGHTECVEVVYDPAEITLEELVRIALENHDPTQKNRQGNDVGTQYRSAFYTVGDDARQQAETVKTLVDAYGKVLAGHGFGPVTTEIMPLADTPAGTYYRAEDEHQQYLHKNPGGYCPHHGTGIGCGPE
ncbi:peptide-methionine (S)-S-oxide reductase MsrA [Corynebacterium mendelii]|uniref:Peptide methionine sulfoxide reductase MsrA n=1 Tax=Corynebacterium mendelii TaxID=2765362 RepID=A0A939IZ44_9CORY|nr:peptide-methionine (S)-S-oxide reductase MsrA [Corynebacterium mendelii]MBN9645322.1 peptide-methionine (S)-S-oxide reductase MsrA [Corynebacterium mendelii]